MFSFGTLLVNIVWIVIFEILPWLIEQSVPDWDTPLRHCCKFPAAYSSISAHVVIADLRDFSLWAGWLIAIVSRWDLQDAEIWFT